MNKYAVQFFSTCDVTTLFSSNRVISGDSDVPNIRSNRCGDETSA